MAASNRSDSVIPFCSDLTFAAICLASGPVALEVYIFVAVQVPASPLVQPPVGAMASSISGYKTVEGQFSPAISYLSLALA
jgi:hypothetical protein